MKTESRVCPNEPMAPWPAIAGWGKTITLNDNRLFFYDSKDSAANCSEKTETKPAIFFIHGLGDEADSWRHLLPILAGNGYRVIAPDLPGFGRSARFTRGASSPQSAANRWKGRISINTHARAIQILMSETGAASATRPAILAGSSLGAVIAEIIAVEQPDLIKALILLDGCLPLAGNPGKSAVMMSLSLIGRSWYRAFRKNHEAAWKSLYPYYYDLDSMPAEDKDFLRRRVIDRVESSNQEHGYFSTLRGMNRLSMSGTAEFSRGIKKFAEKTLLLWGEADNVLPAGKAAAFRLLCPAANFQLIPNAGHLPHQEAPEKTAETILRFLKNNGSV